MGFDRMRKMMSFCLREREGRRGERHNGKRVKKMEKRRRVRGLGWWVWVKEMEGGTCRNLIGFGGFVERERI